MKISAQYHSISYLLCLASLLVLNSCNSHSAKYNSLEGIIWNTTYHITYNGDADMTDSIYAVLNQIDKSLNVFDSQSIVSLVNERDSMEVDEDFVTVYTMSKKIYDSSRGRFDPTLGPLIDAWGFGKGHKATSDTLRLDSLLQITGLSKTKLSGNKIIKEQKEIRFNFSAIAKGYACDRIGAMLNRNGCDSYLVEIGGEIRCSGKSPSNSLWRISIDKPILSDSILHESQCVVEVTDCGIATSGNYRNFHKMGDTVYGHTISSETGRPTVTDIISATVISQTAMESDALATAMMALGKKEATQLADSLGVGVLLIMTDGTTWQNDKFEALCPHLIK